MKKILVATVTVLTALTLTTSANAAGGTLRSKTETKIAATTSSVSGVKVLRLPKRETLVTWQEEINGIYYIKARKVSATNKLGLVQTINTSPAIPLDRGDGNANTVVVNGAGKIFATWVTQGLRYGVQSQKIWGRTSSDGISWSRAFVIVSGLTVSGDADTCEMEPGSAGCGYSLVQAAIDGKGRLAILTGDGDTNGGLRFRTKATNFEGKWCNYKTLTTTPEYRHSSIVGLTSGFASSATVYSFDLHSVKVNFYDPKLEKWTNTSTAISTDVNNVYRTQWVQRDKSNLTLVIAGEATGISMRNFSTTTQYWTEDAVVLQESEGEVVYQNVLASKVGADLVLIYPWYNQTNGANEVRAMKVVGTTPTTTLLHSEGDQSWLMYVGSDSTNNALVAFTDSGSGTYFGGITDGSLPALLDTNNGPKSVFTITKSSADEVFAITGTYVDGKTTLYLVKGFAN